MEFAPKDGYFPDVWVRLIADIANRKVVMVKETFLWKQDEAQSTFRRLLKKGKAVKSNLTLPKIKLAMYQAPDKQIFPYAEKVLLSLKAAWKEDKNKFHFLKEYDTVSLLYPSPSEDWNVCLQTFQASRSHQGWLGICLGKISPLSLPNTSRRNSRLVLSWLGCFLFKPRLNTASIISRP